MKVLFADDEPDALEIYAEIYPHYGIETITFDNVPEAIEYLRSNEVDGIVADIFMPGCNGIEFFKKIQSENLHKGFFSFLTGKWQPEFSYLLQQGVHTVFHKPLSPEELTNYIQKFKKENPGQSEAG